MGRVMRAAGRARSRARRSERGAALVEAAIVLPLVLLIIFGAIEYGVAFKDSGTISAAARAGARIAAAEPRVPTMPDDTAQAVASALKGFPQTPNPEVWVYLAGPNGYPMGTSGFFSGGCGQDCVRYQLEWHTDSGGYFQPVVMNGGTIPAADQHVCPGDGPTVWSQVGVYVQASHDKMFAGLLPVPSTLHDFAVFRLEPIASSLCG